MSEKYTTNSEFVQSLAKDIENFIKNGAEQSDAESEKVFNDLSMRLFEYQYNANHVYQKYCDKRGVRPEMINEWTDVPAVPAAAFKEVELRTFPAEETVLFLTSSGTTNPEKRAKISFNEPMLKIYDQVGISINDRGLYKSADEKLHAIVLGPNPDEMPSVAIGMRQLKISVDRHSKGKPEFFIKPTGFDFAGLAEKLRQVERSGEPCVMVGATFGYVHFFDYCEAQGISFKLPEGSRAMDGGGNKGKGREISKEEYLRLGEKILGIPPDHLINLYGMTEMQAAYFDNVFYNHVRGISEPRYKMIPHFARVVVVDPDTLKPLPKGERGLLRQHSVANLVTVQAVQTDDMGFEIGSGFEVTGRARDAETRGCSIAYDELISAQRA
ncbi:hypothetical protein GX441_02495 [bacterium]|nr:hypothetical protein [bacterium]